MELRHLLPTLLLALGCGRREPTHIGPAAALEPAIEAERARLGVPGAAVVVVRRDSVILLQGFGLRDVPAGLPVTPKTLFSIGSCTKPFTALALVLGADQGILSLDDPPRRYLPYFALRDPAANAQVTLRDLLSHRTGVPDDLPYGWFERYPTHEALIRAAMQSHPDGAFRTAFHYNNYMFLAAGEALAVAAGSSTRRSAANVSRGYSPPPNPKPMPWDTLAYLSGIAPAGGINASVADMAQWLRLMLGRGVLEGRRLVSDSGYRQLLTPMVHTSGGAYGLGLFIEEWHGHRLYSHPGGVLGFGTRCEFVPDLDLGWVVLTNVDDQQLPKAIRDLVYTALVAGPDR